MEIRRPPGIRCHKCRHDLEVMDTALTDAHSGEDHAGSSCETLVDNSHIFLLEDQLPDWIRAKVEEEGWQRGRLHCRSCGGKIGSFDFVSGRKCGCRQSILPSVHLIRSQVDTVVDVRELTSHDKSNAVL